MGLDKLLAGLHLVAHKDIEEAVGLLGVVNGHLFHRPGLRVHRRVPQLLGIHFAKTLVALNIDASDLLAALALGRRLRGLA